MVEAMQSVDWEEHERAQRQRRRIRVARRVNELMDLKKAGFRVEEQKDFGHYRVDGVLNLYLVHNRFRDERNHERGGFDRVREFVFRRLRNGN